MTNKAKAKILSARTIVNMSKMMVMMMGLIFATETWCLINHNIWNSLQSLVKSNRRKPLTRWDNDIKKMASNSTGQTVMANFGGGLYLRGVPVKVNL